MEITNAITLKVMVDNQLSYECNEEMDCTIETFQAGLQPTYNSPNNFLFNTIALTGTGLNLAGENGCILSFAGIVADNCNVDDVGQVFGTYTMGVPSPYAAELPSLTILTENAGVMAEHKVSSEGANPLDNTFVAPGAGSNVVGSFAGGRPFEIAATGLAQNVLGGISRVTVCGNEATLLTASSDSGKAVFEVPQLRTTASENSSNRVEPSLLEVRNPFASDQHFIDTIFDGLNVPGISVGSGIINNYVGIKFDDEKKGILDEIRFFMDYFNGNYERYNGKLKFQGSNDDFVSEIEDIVIVGNEVHEGWNSYPLEKPDFKSYRLFHASKYGLNNIGEL